MHKLEQAKQAVLAGELDTAESIYRGLLAEDADSVAALAGLGAVLFERGELEESLRWFEEARDAGIRAHGGKLPKSLVWNEHNKPLLRALHGIGLNLFRMKKDESALAAFEEVVRLNPDDNQGAKLMIADIKQGRYPWKTT